MARADLEKPLPPPSPDLRPEPDSPELGNRAEAHLQESESFWDTADSLLPYIKAPKTYKDASNTGNVSSDFWNEADRTLELPPWRQSGSKMDEWLESLPGWEDGFLQEFTEKVKAEEQEQPGETLTSPPIQHFLRQRRKSDALRRELQLQSIQEESTPRSDADTPASMRDRMLRKPRPLGQMSTTLRDDKINNVPSPLYAPPSPPKTGANSIEAGVEALSPGEVDAISQSLVNKLSELERKWKSEGVEVTSVMKRMLYVVDKLVLDDFAEEQRRERGNEMGWGK